MKQQIETGNAIQDSKETRQWLVGSFINPKESLRSTSNLEIKWGYSQKGEKRKEWSTDNDSTSIAILQKGKVKFIFPDQEIILGKEGDYVIWGVGIPHKWIVEEDSLVITIRWKPK